MKVLSIGKGCFDITSCIDKDVEFGKKNKLMVSNKCGGGSAANVAYLLGKWGVDVSIATLLGADSYAEAIKKEFSEVNVNTNFLETNFEQPTNLQFITINNQNKQRTVYNIESEYKALKKYNYDFTPDIVFSDGYDYGATQNAVNKYTSAINILDAREVTNETLELSKYMKNIIASLDFAIGVTGLNIDYENSSTLVNLYSKLSGKYPNSNVVITLSDNGALYKDGDQIKIMPGLKMEAIDITGAKDAFIAAYIYSLINNDPVEKMISLSNIAAGLTTKTVGGRSSFPALSEMLDVYNQKVGAIQTTAAPNAEAPAPSVDANAQTPQAPVTPEVQSVENAQVAPTPSTENVAAAASSPETQTTEQPSAPANPPQA